MIKKTSQIVHEQIIITKIMSFLFINEKYKAEKNVTRKHNKVT